MRRPSRPYQSSSISGQPFWILFEKHRNTVYSSDACDTWCHSLVSQSSWAVCTNSEPISCLKQCVFLHTLPLFIFIIFIIVLLAAKTISNCWWPLTFKLHLNSFASNAVTKCTAEQPDTCRCLLLISGTSTSSVWSKTIVIICIQCHPYYYYYHYFYSHCLCRRFSSSNTCSYWEQIFLNKSDSLSLIYSFLICALSAYPKCASTSLDFHQSIKPRHHSLCNRTHNAGRVSQSEDVAQDQPDPDRQQRLQAPLLDHGHPPARFLHHHHHQTVCRRSDRLPAKRCHSTVSHQHLLLVR